MNRPSLAARKARLKHRIVYSPQTDDMPVATFSRLLTSLDAARTHADLDDAARAWKEAMTKQT